MGTCPEYLVQIYADGEIRYVGFRNTAIVGVRLDSPSGRYFP